MSAFPSSRLSDVLKKDKPSVGNRPELVVETLLCAAGASFLSGRAPSIAVRTVNATIAFKRLEQLAAAFAFIEELTRVRGHQFLLGEVTY